MWLVKGESDERAACEIWVWNVGLCLGAGTVFRILLRSDLLFVKAADDLVDDSWYLPGTRTVCQQWNITVASLHCGFLPTILNLPW